MPVKLSLTSCLLLLLSGFAARAGDFDDFLKPLVAQKCAKCHGDKKVNGDVNLSEIETASQFLEQPGLIDEMIKAVGDHNMPPEGEPGLDEKVRTKLLATLKTMLREATSDDEMKPLQIRRLNRFQYNNAVKDLFQLKIDVFELPEKMMTRHGNYLHAGLDRMPRKVNVTSLSLNPKAGFRGAKAFPRDLRASHGFDNQANQLTLSPLLLDAFLQLAWSILESPDFNEQNVGIWDEFFKEPSAETEMQREVQSRLEPFLKICFRGPVDGQTLNRYTAYALSNIDQGQSFPDSMRKVASAALSSPLFLYRSEHNDREQHPFSLASKLSFLLWGSSPDMQLLRQAESGELARPENLSKTIERMLADPKIERFLDTFPAQWMQLENALAVTPDPEKNRYFSLDQNNPASLQMVLEPLLLFDAVFIEDRPIVELIAPKFSYQSDFLKTWYTSDLTPPMVDTAKVVEDNLANEAKRNELKTLIGTTQAELDALTKPLRARLLSARKKEAADKEPVDLQPYAAWEFDGDLKESINSIDLTAHGDIRYNDGMVILDEAYLLSKKLPIELKAKTLEVWLRLHDLDQGGGGAMGIQGPGDFFDTIVIGERKARHWISGSNGFSRTEDFPESTAEHLTDRVLHLAMVYTADGTTTLYRNGESYGKPYRKDSATFPKDETSVIFGLRHLPPGGNKYLSVSLDKARLYTRALTAAEVALSASGNIHYITQQELLQVMTPEQKAKKEALTKILEQSQVALKEVPQAQDPALLQHQASKRYEDEIRNKMRSPTFERVPASDPRYGGVITCAAMLSMTSGPRRTHPIARGAWIIEVIFNDPPPPPPNDVPPLNEEDTSANLTIREKFAKHRENPDCAACHSRLDPLGFALENFDITGRWRDKYDNGRDVDASGTMLEKYDFDGIVEFKKAIVSENRRFARAFVGHLLRFALSRELRPADSLTIDDILDKTENDNFRIKSILREVILSKSVSNIPM